MAQAPNRPVSTPAIVTIGNFDGVHRGHLQLIRQAVDRARAIGVCSFAITFEPHPEQVLFPERKLTYLSTAEERRELLLQEGIDSVWICPFTQELSRLEPEDFMRLVTERQPLAELWVGSDFALGRGRSGTIAVLAEMGNKMGWALHVVPPYMLEGQVVSSTAIRTLLAAGAVRGAADLLGRNYSVSGNVLGADFLVDPLRALPRPGAYAAELRVGQGPVLQVTVSVLATPGRLTLQTSSGSERGGPATVTFVRRAD
jgi:riboflavin kinase/FMN adenylyltransferase